MKLVIIGGGSTYTPELFQELIHARHLLPISEVVLHDIDAERLQTVGRFCSLLLQHATGPFQLTLSTDIETSVTDADAVVFQLRVGGQEARHQDIMLGTDLGIVGQETTGIGGFAKAMRTIPVVLEYCRIIALCAKPSCRIINFTNPSGIVTQAISDHTDLPVIGLCNIPVILQKQAADLLSIPKEQLLFDYVGLNHLGWMRGVYHQGTNHIGRLVEALADDPELFRASNHSAIDSSLVRSLGMIPSPYLQYFYYTDTICEKIRDAAQTRAEIVMNIDRRILDYFSTDTTGVMPPEMKGRGGELYSYAAVQVLISMATNRQDVQIVNTRNGSAIPELLSDDIIEVPSVISQNGAVPLVTGKIEPSILGLIQQVKAYERLTVTAAVHRRYDDALFALFNNPLTGDLSQAKKALDLYLTRNPIPLMAGAADV